MSENETRRRGRVLSPETKWEIFLQVTSRGDDPGGRGAQVAGRRVDGYWDPPVGEGRGARGVGCAPGPAGEGAELGVGGGAPGGGAVDRGGQGAGHRVGDVAGKSRLGLSGPLPARVPGAVKEQILELVDDAVSGGASHRWACSLLGVSDDRVRRWRRRLRARGTVEDIPRSPATERGGSAVCQDANLACSAGGQVALQLLVQLLRRGGARGAVGVSCCVLRPELGEIAASTANHRQSRCPRRCAEGNTERSRRTDPK